MDDIQLMQVLHCRCDLACVYGCSPLVEVISLLEGSVELTACCVLHDHVDSLLVEEEAVHLEYVGVL